MDLAVFAEQNTGAARSATIHVANSDFVLNQAAGNTPGFTLTPTLAKTIFSRGFNSTVTVTADNPTLNWTAVSNVSWIRITSATPQTGNGTVSYSLDQNAGPRRTGSMTIAGLTFVVIQAGASCSFSLNSTIAEAAANGQSVRLDGSASSSGCPWTAVNTAPFITITSGSTGVGNGSVNLAVAPNPSSRPRVGRLRIAMQTVTIVQSRTEPVFTLNPTSANFTAAGGTNSVALSVTPADATWIAVSDVPWISTIGQASGSGNANIQYSVSANSGPARSGRLVAGGQIFTVNQAQGNAGFTLNPLSANFRAAGGNAAVAVSQTGPASNWVATSNSPWITITAGATGNGDVAVNYAVAANPGANARTGSMTIAGNLFEVTQSGNGAQAGSRFVPVIPCRIADTRNAAGQYGGPILGGNSRRTFAITGAACGIPASAQAFSLNITALPSGSLGFLTVWPTGQAQPLVSTLNSGDGRIVEQARAAAWTFS